MTTMLQNEGTGISLPTRSSFMTNPLTTERHNAGIEALYPLGNETQSEVHQQGFLSGHSVPPASLSSTKTHLETKGNCARC